MPWCYAIARNVHVDHLRARAADRARAAAEGASDAEPAAGPEADGEQVTAAAELAAIVERTLARIPPNQREAFVLLRYEGLSVAEAAAVVGVTEGAVKLRAFHAYEALRAALGTAKKSPGGAS
jgi:RNA polymerase sigma-70 factor (ECF subfamily)